jgi:transcriptional regulator with XRE-family HTH domain
MPLTRELDPTAGPLHFFGAEVRRWRTAAGQSQEQLGQQIGYSAALVGRVELGDRSPSMDFATGCDRALPAADGLFGRLYQLARQWAGGYPSWFAEWVEAERRATMLRTWQPLLVPGLLQTADYARALFLAWHAAESDDQVDQQVSARIERQAIFQRDEPPVLWAVLDEGVLRRRIGGAPTMRGQLQHLLEVSERSTITVQVVPGNAGAHVGLRAPFLSRPLRMPRVSSTSTPPIRVR